MKPVFGQLLDEVHELTAHATTVARAIQTLEMLPQFRSGNDDDMAVCFVRESWEELTELLKWFYAQGVKPQHIDYGGFVEKRASS